MDRTVEACLRQLRLGTAVDAGPLILVPLFSPQECSLDFIALSAALASGAFAVREAGSTGVVGTLLAENSGDRPVLLLDGQELAGAKQNRVLNTTILVTEHSAVTIPVSCTEHGRWAYTSDRFQESLSPAPPRLRRMNQRAVAASLEARGEYAGDQMRVWDCVERLSHETGVHSGTSAMRDVFESRLQDIDRIGSAAPCQAGQTGLIAIAGADVLGCDVVPRPEVYAALHKTIVRSYAMDALLSPKCPPAPLAATLAMDFLGDIFASSERRFKSVGCGDDFRYGGTRVVGSGLVCSGCLVHAAFFRLPPGEEAFGEPPLPGSRTRMAFRRRQGEADGTTCD